MMTETERIVIANLIDALHATQERVEALCVMLRCDPPAHVTPEHESRIARLRFANEECIRSARMLIR